LRRRGKGEEETRLSRIDQGCLLFLLACLSLYGSPGGERKKKCKKKRGGNDREAVTTTQISDLRDMLACIATIGREKSGIKKEERPEGRGGRELQWRHERRTISKRTPSLW